MISYPSSPLDLIDKPSTRRMQYDIDVRMNYMPHTGGRKSARWSKVKQHLISVTRTFAVAKAEDLHQIILLVGEDKIPPVFGPLAAQFHDAVKRQVALSSVVLGDGEKITLWAYDDDTKFEFVPAFVPRENRSMSPLKMQFPKFEMPPQLEKLMT